MLVITSESLDVKITSVEIKLHQYYENTFEIIYNKQISWTSMQ